MPSPVAKIGNVLLLGSSCASWPLVPGVKPSIVDFDVMPKDTQALENLKGKPQTLTWNVRGVDLKVENVYVLHIGPGDSKNINTVSIGDRRWLWSLAHYIKRMNIRRNVGYQRLKATNQAALNPVAPKVWYAKWSMAFESTDPTKARYKAKDALQKVLKYLSDFEKNYSGGAFSLKIENNIANLLDGLPIEQLEVDDTADQALNRILKYLPGAAVKCLLDGTIVVYNQAGGEDVQAEKDLGPEIVGGGHAMLVNNSAIRPKSIKFRFTPQLEFRLDSTESSTYNSTQTDGDVDTRTMENVLPIPDYQLQVGNDLLVQGTWITFEQALAAWNALGVPGIGRLDYDIILRAMVPWMGLWSALKLMGLRDPSADWAARIAAIEAHFRRTYRINPRIMDRTFSIMAERCATIDPVRGQRAPAVAYTDYCIIPSMKAHYAQASANADLSAVMNVPGYPTDGLISSTSKVAPASVKIIDPDQGIIQLDFLVDPMRMAEQVLPGMIEINGDAGKPGTLPSRCGPTMDLTVKGRTHAYNAVVTANGWPKLIGGHKASVILSLIPAAPNDERQLYEVEIKPEDIKDLLPKSLTGGVTDAKGPTMEVRIGPGVEVARVIWADSRASDIEFALGINNFTEGSAKANLKDLVTNEGQLQDSQFGGSLMAIAKAQAAAIYASLADRMLGEKTGNLNPKISPVGFISDVTHEIGTDGTGKTHITFPEQLPQMSLWQFMDAGTRAILMRLVR